MNICNTDHNNAKHHAHTNDNRIKSSNNSATNLAASVPTSGTIDFDDFYSQAKGFRKTYTSGATNQDA